MISKEEVVRIAHLARIELTEAEIEKMQKDLSSILEYFAILKKAPKVKRIDQALVKNATLQATRKDVVEHRPASVANNLIAQAPQHRDQYIQVKSVLS